MKVTTDCYIVFEPQHNYAGSLTGVKADRMLKDRPQRLGARHVAVRLVFEFDSVIFQQYLPEILVPITGSEQILLPAVSVMSPVVEPDAPVDLDAFERELAEDPPA